MASAAPPSGTARWLPTPQPCHETAWKGRRRPVGVGGGEKAGVRQGKDGRGASLKEGLRARSHDTCAPHGKGGGQAVSREGGPISTRRPLAARPLDVCVVVG